MARMSPREQGDLGELSAMEWLAFHGYSVYVPVGHSPHVDIVALGGDEVLRVQVKTSTRCKDGRWEVMICTRGGNRSWNGVVKHFSASRCDLLFVHVGDGRRWCIPADVIESTSGLRLGGPKYAHYEIEPGRPISASITC